MWVSPGRLPIKQALWTIYTFSMAVALAFDARALDPEMVLDCAQALKTTP